ncbi:MAG: ATP-dependent RecD-like DNA helicase [Desulfatitalea sp.]|nr:ATP-dependent RecD-like DNA helicase [Desulfatitalea sp.]NNK00020.1 ATP-dependent RecD-like DNA helicase [Desulfatitalea sp.]
MSTQSESSDSASVTLSGQVASVNFSDDQSGFTIARIDVNDLEQPVTVVGELMAPVVGTLLNVHGHWVQHPRYGRQFRVERFESRVPTTREGIEKYLGSGSIEGLGPIVASRIVEHFGDQTLDILNTQFHRLREVNGIGKKRWKQIRRSWNAQKQVRDAMLFLQSHGLGAAQATKIIGQYGQSAMTLVQHNPYRLAGEIEGIGFLTADRIASRLGFDSHSPLRIQSGILHVLDQMTGNGHVYVPHDLLVEKAGEALGTKPEPLIAGLEHLHTERQIVIEPMMGEATGTQDRRQQAVYPSLFHYCEVFIARRLRFLAGVASLWHEADAQQAMAWVQRRMDLELAPKQRQAVAMALNHKLLVITGGPGTGKTTIVRAITLLYQQRQAAMRLAAPTGRAAKRLSEATGRPAKTIHRLLEFSPTEGGFQRNDTRPLNAQLVIVDEASMIDVVLMHHLLKALPSDAALILVGDANQLPSVGPGNVLRDIISSQTVPVVILDQIFRQARASRIVVNAHRINAGHMPQVAEDQTIADNDFFFIEQADAEKSLNIILALTSERIPRRFGLDSVDGIQVLTPMHRGILGAVNLNRALQDRLNPQQVYVMRGEHRFALEDKVMQIRNNYEKEVFNGDIGRITEIDAKARKLWIRFDERRIAYDYSELDELTLAYAVSVHKAQGSEFPAVVIPVTTQHYVLLQRNLFYTAVTRARRLVVLVGTRRAMAIAVNNNMAGQRYTLLDRRLAQM